MGYAIQDLQDVEEREYAGQEDGSSAELSQMDSHPVPARGIVHEGCFNRLATSGMYIENDHCAHDLTDEDKHGRQAK